MLSKRIYTAIFSFSFLLSSLVFSEDTGKSSPEMDTKKIKEFIKEFKVKITKKEVLQVIDNLVSSNKISKDEAEKARKEISAMKDSDFDVATEKVINQIPDDLTVDQAKKKVDELEKKKK